MENFEWYPPKQGYKHGFLVRDWVGVKSLETENFLDDFGNSGWHSWGTIAKAVSCHMNNRILYS